MKTYEAIFVLDPDLSEEDTENSLKKIENILTTQKAKILFTEQWGKRKFAYRVKKKIKGNYFRLVFYGEGKVVSVLEKNLKFMEEVLKFLTVKLSDTEIDIQDKELRKIRGEGEGEGARDANNFFEGSPAGDDANSDEDDIVKPLKPVFSDDEK